MRSLLSVLFTALVHSVHTPTWLSRPRTTAWVAEVVSYLSQFMTLLPGDVGITGTPQGVCLGIKPTPQFLKRGDVMTLSAGVLGTRRQRII